MDISSARVALVNDRKSLIVDAEIEAFLATRALNLTATTDAAGAYRDAEFVIVATPTNYDEKSCSAPRKLDRLKVEFSASISRLGRS